MSKFYRKTNICERKSFFQNSNDAILRQMGLQLSTMHANKSTSAPLIMNISAVRLDYKRKIRQDKCLP